MESRVLHALSIHVQSALCSTRTLDANSTGLSEAIFVCSLVTLFASTLVNASLCSARGPCLWCGLCAVSALCDCPGTVRARANHVLTFGEGVRSGISGCLLHKFPMFPVKISLLSVKARFLADNRVLSNGVGVWVSSSFSWVVSSAGSLAARLSFWVPADLRPSFVCSLWVSECRQSCGSGSRS